MNTSPIKILIVEDDEDDFFITKEYIERIKNQQFVIDWCPLYTEALKKICSKEYALYLVDYYLGARTSLQLLKEAIASDCEEPVVLLTGRGDHTMDIEVIQAGAYDYLVKAELSTEKLERCIRYSMEKAQAVKALRENEMKFRNIFERSKDMVFVADENFIFKNVKSGG